MDPLLGLQILSSLLQATQPTDRDTADTAEKVNISSLALIKMLKHATAGVPLEVMGLMLGQFVDDYTVTVSDVFAMPQSGTAVSVEAVDPVFQANMAELLKQTGRTDMVVGWYHSHPGFDCWLSFTDMITQDSFEQLNKRAVAVVIDPVQSVKGKVLIDAFRLIESRAFFLNEEPRQITSNLGHLEKPSPIALLRGLNAAYYSLNIVFSMTEMDQEMLLYFHKKPWFDGLMLRDYEELSNINEKTVTEMLALVKAYSSSVEDEDTMTPEQLAIRYVGKQDPKRRLEECVDALMASNIVQILGASLNFVFQ